MKKYKSEASRAIHEVAEAMNAAGIIPDERMREFDSRHLAGSVLPAPRIPAQGSASPAHSGAAVFAGRS